MIISQNRLASLIRQDSELRRGGPLEALWWNMHDRMVSQSSDAVQAPVFAGFSSSLGSAGQASEMVLNGSLSSQDLLTSTNYQDRNACSPPTLSPQDVFPVDAEAASQLFDQLNGFTVTFKHLLQFIYSHF